MDRARYIQQPYCTKERAVLQTLSPNFPPCSRPPSLRKFHTTNQTHLFAERDGRLQRKEFQLNESEMLFCHRISHRRTLKNFVLSRMMIKGRATRVFSNFCSGAKIFFFFLELTLRIDYLIKFLSFGRNLPRSATYLFTQWIEPN